MADRLTNEMQDGLSPRVRGNRQHDTHVAGQRRSIPARAGEPKPEDSDDPPASVYPRACGGTAGRL